MDFVPGDLAAASLAARERLADASRAAAAANARPGAPQSQAAMAGAARAAVFADAVIAAMHARLGEFKSVAK